VITTVFRDHARGKIVDGRAIAKDPVRVQTPRISPRFSSRQMRSQAAGNINAARDVARQALAAGTACETRPLLERLAAFDYQGRST